MYHFTTIQHGNGKDWWIISMKENLIEFDIYLLSESGFQSVSTQTFPLPVYFSNHNRSPLISSPKGEWIYRQFISNSGYLFNFDRCSGKITYNAEVLIPDSISIPKDDVYGMKYPIGSPAGRFIYACFIDKITINGKQKDILVSCKQIWKLQTLHSSF
ncbi:MAG: hypothetical protein IPJ06_18090 [Saprospiraceae bacterium]|nr:hypothetical protein [Saprospiraceae bacterium]